MNTKSGSEITVRGEPRRSVNIAILWAVLVLALLATYSNHFQNGFHFDDAHTVENNFYIRDLRYIPKLLTDATTATPLVQNQIYRPLVSVSLAIDYWLGGGLKPFWFHASTFAWYLALLPLLYLCFVHVMDRTSPGTDNRYVALFAVAWFALHPVMAETVNYVYQRGDLYATIGVVGSIVVYAAFPAGRQFGAYLIPALVGMLAKQSAMMFAPLLFVYILLFETQWGLKAMRLADLRTAAMRSIPAFVLAGCYYLFQREMTPPTWEPGGTSALLYWYTQPIVLLHYVTSLFLPTGLSADTDRRLLTSPASTDFVVGALFLAAAAFVLWRTCQRRDTRPIAFGVAWFFIASAPTSLLPLAEVENDHRMFFPYVGLVLAVCWCGALLARSRGWKLATLSQRAAVAVGAVLFLSAYAYGAHMRNEVWRSEETLWKDVTIKSPRNGRGLMNYGLALMARGDFAGARHYFEEALVYTPNYYVLETNLGVVHGATGNAAEAERHFQRSITLSPNAAGSYFFYARWLNQVGRQAEAIQQLKHGIGLNEDDLQLQHLLMQIYLDRGDAANLKALATETLARFPGDVETTQYLAADPLSKLRAAEAEVRARPTAASFLNLSLYYEQAGRHQECIDAAREALKLQPDYAEAYNNIAAAYLSMQRWDEAIEAAQQAIALKPDFQLAKNNLRYAQSQKK